MKRLLLNVLALALLCLLNSPLLAQNYQLTNDQRAEMTAIKNGALRLGLGLDQLIDNPDMEDQFLVVDGKLSFIATSKTTPAQLRNQLVSAGAKDCIVINQLVCGRMPMNLLSNLESVAALKMAMPEYKPKLNVGLVDSEGDRSMLTDEIRNNLFLNGTGIKIGILSDTYNALGGAGASVLAGDLPGPGNPNGFTTPVTVLKDLPTGSDEGRGIAELIHDVAPGAELFFYTAFDGLFDFAAGIRALEAAGCDIIIDDVSYFTENYFQDGAVGGAVDEVASQGVAYFSSAGNAASFSYEDDFRASGLAGPFGGELQDFGGGDIAHTISVPDGATIQLWIMWDDPSPAFNDKPNPAPRTDLDAFLFDATTFALLDFSVFDNVSEGFNIEIIQYTNATGADQTVDLLVERFSGPSPRRLKYIDRAESVVFVDPQGANAGTCVGHSNVAGSIAVGASAFFNTPEFNDFRADLGAGPLSVAVINSFSSSGGTPLLIDPAGNPIAPQLTNNPFIVGPDGTNTSFFGTDTGLDPDVFPNFFGTSAAAPHLAAATALILQTNPGLTNGEIRTALQTTAEDMDDPRTNGFDTGYDLQTGFGFVNALDAISQVLDGCDDVEPADLLFDPKKGTRIIKVAEVGIYRAVETTRGRGNVFIERRMDVGIDIFDSNAKDGFTSMARTNGAGDDGELVALTVEQGVPFVYIRRTRRGNTFINKYTPITIAPRRKGQTRFMTLVAEDVAFNGCNGNAAVAAPMALSANVTTFPNPSSDVVTINRNQDQAIRVFIYDFSGRMVQEATFNTGEEASLDLAQFGKGKYFAIVSFKDGSIIRKQILIEK